MAPAWITNDPSAAKQLRAIDRAYDRARAKAAGWPLDLKISWYAKCSAARDAAYARMHARLSIVTGEKS